MNDNLQDLVKRYQAGEDDLFYTIDEQLTGINGTVIKEVCGEYKRIFLNLDGEFVPKDTMLLDNEKMDMTLEPFQFNNYDLDKAINKSLKDALRTYNSEKKAKFITWYYITLRDDLKNLRAEYEREQDQGINIKNIEQFEEARARIYGSPYDPDIIKQETNFTDEEMEKMSSGQQKYVCLVLSLALRNLTITDSVAGEALGISRRQVLRYREALRDILQSYGEKMQRVKEKDDLPDLEMFNRIKDPVPRAAIKNIKNNS